MEQILQKATELGVKCVIPVESENSQVRLKDKKKEKQLRWQKIVAAAAEQCGRGIIPTVAFPCSLQDAVASLDADTVVVFCYEKEGNNSISQALKEMKRSTKKIALVIGPEGGFSAGEAQMIRANDVYCVTLGKRILRTETAGIAVLAVVMYEFQEWEVVD
jgi:16S rRNA (uracil1498-N3)-methyltransferase